MSVDNVLVDEIAVEHSSIVHVLEHWPLRWRDKLQDGKLIYDIITFSFTQKEDRRKKNIIYHWITDIIKT